jgi:glycosyltransferase involved in cell wall biosynthesis
MDALSLLAEACVLAVSVPIAILALECLPAVLRGRPAPRAASGARPPCVVLVPAHDEEGWIGATLCSLASELGPRDRLLVVAHNCGDHTAQVARAAGAEVIEARDAGTGGKPDALVAGLRALDAQPPELVVIVDADCVVSPGSIDALARAAWERRTSVQGIYLFGAASEARTQSISSLALLVKNLVRPLGLHRWGLNVLLNGAGSAYPFAALREAPHGQGSIAEDYQLAIDLARRGYYTRFCPQAEIHSTLPAEERSALRQRRRWEHGHLYLVFAAAPRLVLEGLLRARPGLLVLGLDLLVPPLAFLVLAWAAATTLATSVWAAGGRPWALASACAAGFVLAAAVLGSWVRFAGLGATCAALVRVPGYVLWKLPLYLGFFRRREKRWTKTAR